MDQRPNSSSGTFGNLVGTVLVGGIVGGVAALVAYLVLTGGMMSIALLSPDDSSPEAGSSTVPEWRVRASSPTASDIEVEWQCDLSTGNDTQTRGGTARPSSMGDNLVRGHSERISCSLWKRGEGKLVVALYRNTEVVQRVESTVNPDLIILSGSIR